MKLNIHQRLFLETVQRDLTVCLLYAPCSLSDLSYDLLFSALVYVAAMKTARGSSCSDHSGFRGVESQLCGWTIQAASSEARTGDQDCGPLSPASAPCAGSVAAIPL